MLLLKVYFRTLKQVFRSPTRLGIVFFFPLGFTFVFWFMFGGAAGLDSGSSVSIGIINDDEGILSEWEDNFTSYGSSWSDNSYLNPFKNLLVHIISVLLNMSNTFLPDAEISKAGATG